MNVTVSFPGFPTGPRFAFRERVAGMIGSVCAGEFVAKPSFMGCQRCDYRDLCEVGEKGREG